MCAVEKLRVSGYTASSKQSEGPMTARRHCPSSHRTGVCSTLATAHCLNPTRFVVPIPHPIVVDNGSGCRDIHHHHLVLCGSFVLALDFRHQHHSYWLPGPKSCLIIVEWRLLLSEDVAGNVLWHLYNMYLKNRVP